MLTFIKLLILYAAAASASPVSRRAAPNFSIQGDVAFSISQDTLAASLVCPNGNPTTKSRPVLLVHGTGSSGPETWTDGYVPALLANGYTACYVTLPGRAMGDMQISSEYVAYNLHYLSSLSGGQKVAVISHSQGGPVTQWALQFWPSTRGVTRAFVPLSPDFTGIDLLSSALSPICDAIKCQASIWQQRYGSKYYKALQSRDFRALVPTTSIYTKFDEVVVPSDDNANLPSAKVVSVQQLCPLRTTDHVFMTIDAAAFTIALDALNHDGIASITRVLPKALSTCFRVNAKGMKVDLANQLEALFNDLIHGFILGGPRVSSEPSIMPYAV